MVIVVLLVAIMVAVLVVVIVLVMVVLLAISFVCRHMCSLLLCNTCCEQVVVCCTKLNAVFVGLTNCVMNILK